MSGASSTPGLTNTWTMPVENRLDMSLTGIKTAAGMKIQGSLDELRRLLIATPAERRSRRAGGGAGSLPGRAAGPALAQAAFPHRQASLVDWSAYRKLVDGKLPKERTMKKPGTPKLQLSKETLHNMAQSQLRLGVGGKPPQASAPTCFCSGNINC